MTAMGTPLGEATGMAALQSAVGWEGPERVDVIEARHLSDYRRAIGLEPDGDEVPVTMCACFLSEPPPLPAAEAFGVGWINGGDRFEFCGPRLKPGERLRSTARLTGVIEKRGRSGTLAILTFETEFVRADGTTAVRHIGTRIRR